MKNEKTARIDRKAAFRIVAVYGIFGALWIFCSDTVLGWFIHDSALMTQIAIYKGLLFVVTTAVLLYYLIARHVQLLTQANRRIAASEERFQAIYDNMLEAVLILVPVTGRIADVNRTACDLFGFCRTEALSLTLREICSDEGSSSDSEPMARLAQAANGLPQLLDLVVRKRDGTLFWADISMQKAEINGEELVITLVRDISERKKIEEEVAFFKKLVETSRDPVYVLSHRQNWRMVYANQAACAHYGMTLEELLQKSIPDWDPDFDMVSLELAWQQLKNGQPMRFETQHRVASGKLVPVEVTTNYLVHRGEELSFGYFFDISERKRAEEELRASEDRLRSLVQALPDLVWLKDQNGVYLSCNQMFERFFGAKEADIIGKTDYDFVEKELADFFVEHDRKAMTAGKPSSNEEWITFADDGHRALLETIKTPMYDTRGALIGVLGIGRDITERKRTEEELRASEARYRGLVELFPEAIYIHTGGKLVFANSHGARLLGVERPEDLYGREALDFVHPDCREFVANRIKSAFEQDSFNPPVEEVFLRADGVPFQVEVSSVAFIYHGEKALQVVARDISERKKRQEELVKAQKLESLGVLAGGIAHDFNNLLTGVLGNISLMREELPEGHPLQERLSRCEKAISQTTGLTCQLLTFSRGGEPVKKLLDLRPVLRDTTFFALRGSNVALELDMAEDLWPLEADEGQLCQVFNNLIINAGQAMPGGGTVRVEAGNCRLSPAEVPPLDAGDYLLISVIDQGTGIASEYLDKIFDPYFTTKEAGSGLGLTALYSIVRKHQGQVLVSSRLGDGTTFRIYLPASPEKEGVFPVPEDDSFRTVSLAGAFILVMDDELPIRELSEDMLRLIGCRVESCSDGEELIELYRIRIREGCRPDAVIMDLTIPGKMGGLEAAQRILELDREARLIVSSGYSNDPVMANYHAYGFAGFLIKPYRIDELSQVLNRVL
ncbi:MAG: PAS domain S-box protein [Deltaproteobacteria bacterium]|nr:PAS domain S-box protein [Deltaproteobacteria bacterium]TLN04974.1 MAG: PAS domain S-box protein [bacterium]